MPREHFYYWDGATAMQITAYEADHDYRDTDAGTDTEFVVRATSQDEAERGARDWLANRTDEDTDVVPDHCGLEERIWNQKRLKGYMLLWVREG